MQWKSFNMKNWLTRNYTAYLTKYEYCDVQREKIFQSFQFRVKLFHCIKKYL